MDIFHGMDNQRTIIPFAFDWKNGVFQNLDRSRRTRRAQVQKQKRFVQVNRKDKWNKQFIRNAHHNYKNYTFTAPFFHRGCPFLFLCDLDDRNRKKNVIGKPQCRWWLGEFFEMVHLECVFLAISWCLCVCMCVFLHLWHFTIVSIDQKINVLWNFLFVERYQSMGQTNANAMHLPRIQFNFRSIDVEKSPHLMITHCFNCCHMLRWHIEHTMPHINIDPKQSVFLFFGLFDWKVRIKSDHQIEIHCVATMIFPTFRMNIFE